MEKWWDGAAAILAFLAAIFWFLSAYGPLPPIVMYWGSSPPTDPFYQAMLYSAKMNTVASLFSGASAFCMGVAKIALHKKENRV